MFGCAVEYSVINSNIRVGTTSLKSQIQPFEVKSLLNMSSHTHHMQESTTEQEQAVTRSKEAITSPPTSPRRHSEGDILDPSAPVKHKPPHSPYSRSTNASPSLERSRQHQATGSTSTSRGAGTKRDPSPTGVGKRAPSPTPSTESESSSFSEPSKQATPTQPPPFTIGEKVRTRHRSVS